MSARALVERLHPNAHIREIGSGANRVFRVTEGEADTYVVKIYPVASRANREQRTLDALAEVRGVPQVLGSGADDGGAWVRLTDGGRWSLASLPKSLETLEAAGRVLREVHSCTSKISDLTVGIDAAYVHNHFNSTVKRLAPFRRRFGLEQDVLDRALDLEPPVATAPGPAHTRPTPAKFAVNDDGDVTLVDWEWATLGPPEWDLTLAVWRIAGRLGEDAAAAFRKGYAAELGESGYRSWVAYHAVSMMLDAAQIREGRLGDLSYLVEDLTEAVLGT